MNLPTIEPTQRYVIVCLLQKLADGDEFSPEDYPLHVTIVPSYQLTAMTEEMLERLSTICIKTKAFSLTAGTDEYFGPEQGVLVSPLVMNDAIVSLHTQLADVLKEYGAIFDETQYMYENYRAHATAQKTMRLHENDSVMISDITIIDKLPNSDPAKRKLLRTLPLLQIA